MAWTKTVVKKTVFGDERVVILKLTADAAESNIETGVNFVDGFQVGAKSLTSGCPKLFENKNSTGTAANGTIGASGFTSGDELFITVYGH